MSATATTSERTPHVLDRDNPIATARQFRDDRFSHPDHPRIVSNGGRFYAWSRTHYREIEDAGLSSQLYLWLEGQLRDVIGGRMLAFKPSRQDVTEVTKALAAITYLDMDQRPPCWLIPGEELPEAKNLLVASNGYLDMSDPAAGLHPNTPALFTVNAIDYAIDIDAPWPTAWVEFLRSLWPNDQASIDLLQEWFGYCLSADTSAQKILLLIGPPRSGKGTIARVLTQLIGNPNVCAPTLAGLGTNFGMSALIDKRLAIVADARLSGRTDIAIVTERLLSISGEDMQTIDRKNREPLSVKLQTRIMLCTNEVPRMPDASTALASRFLALRLSTSHLGKEDTRLTERLTQEMPGILAWALAGWIRWDARRRFTQPESGRHILDELADLSSSVKKFVDDWCRIGPPETTSIKVADLYAAWKVWCEQEGDRPGATSIFSRNLTAACPGVETRQRREAGTGETSEEQSRPRYFLGISLTLSAEAMVTQRLGSRGPGGGPADVDSSGLPFA